MNRIQHIFGIAHPIIQAGMIWCSGWELASAVVMIVYVSRMRTLLAGKQSMPWKLVRAVIVRISGASFSVPAAVIPFQTLQLVCLAAGAA